MLLLAPPPPSAATAPESSSSSPQKPRIPIPLLTDLILSHILPFLHFKIFRNPLIYLSRELQRALLLAGGNCVMPMSGADEVGILEGKEEWHVDGTVKHLQDERRFDQGTLHIYTLNLNQNTSFDCSGDNPKALFHNPISLYELSLLKNHGILRRGMYLPLQLRLYEDEKKYEKFNTVPTNEVSAEPSSHLHSEKLPKRSQGKYHVFHHLASQVGPSQSTRDTFFQSLRLVRHTRTKLLYFQKAAMHPRALLLCELHKMSSIVKFPVQSNTTEDPVNLRKIQSEYREIVEMSLSIFGMSLQYLTEEMANDRHLVMIAVLSDTYALKYASSALRADKNFILDCVKRLEELYTERESSNLDSKFSTPFSPQFTNLEREWMDPRSEILGRRRSHGRQPVAGILNSMRVTLMQDRDIVLAMLKLDPSLVSHFDLNVSLLKEAIRANCRVFNYLPCEMQENQELRLCYAQHKPIADKSDVLSSTSPTRGTTDDRDVLRMLEQLSLRRVSRVDPPLTRSSSTGWLAESAG